MLYCQPDTNGCQPDRVIYGPSEARDINDSGGLTTICEGLTVKHVAQQSHVITIIMTQHPQTKLLLWP